MDSLQASVGRTCEAQETITDRWPVVRDVGRQHIPMTGLCDIY